MSNSAIFREDYQKTPVKTTFSVSSCGDKSGLFNSAETVYSNGNTEINSDLVTRKIIVTDNVTTNCANEITDTFGNSSKFTGGLNEGAFGSRMRIIGNPDTIYKSLQKQADRLKADLIAARSGFNDDRNISSPTPAPEMNSIPSGIMNSISAIDNEVAEGDDTPLTSSGSNLFMSMIADVMSEVSNYTSKFSKASASAQIEKVKLASKNIIEKQKKQLENIMSLPDSPTKERLLNAIKNGDPSAIFVDPSNEGKEKKQVYNKDDYEAKTAEIIPQLNVIENQIC